MTIVNSAAAQTALNASNPLLAEKISQIRYQQHPEIQGAAIASVTVMPDLYQARNYRLAWTNPEAIYQFIDAIALAEQEGLQLADYHYEILQALVTVTELTDYDNPQRVELDILLTDSLIRLTYHLVYGKVHPESLDENWNYTRDIESLNPVTIIQRIIDSPSIKKRLNRLKPQHPIYRQMKQNLKRYRQLARQGGWPTIEPGPTLQKGDLSQRVAQLRERLKVEDDQLLPALDPLLFDDALEQAVMRMQKHYYLEADGIVGKDTINTLNVSVAQRIDQIRVNMERMRWVMHALKGRFVVVDIAGFEVAYYEDDNLVWQARAQVGTPFRKTPIFRDQISYLEFNPTWTVPPTILEKDIWPRLSKSRDILAEKNIWIVDAKGQRVDEKSIDWSQYTAKNFPYYLQQQPGKNNALGQVKFMFPNKHHVYLHDTPNQSLFDKNERTFSSGCIRIERPFELAQILLNDSEQWNRQSFDKIVAEKNTQRIRLPEPVPVLLLYWTSRIDESGEIIFKQDIYQRDKPILDALNAHFKKQVEVATHGKLGSSKN